jgi:hypothetical protein
MDVEKTPKAGERERGVTLYNISKTRVRTMMKK